MESGGLWARVSEPATQVPARKAGTDPTNNPVHVGFSYNSCPDSAAVELPKNLNQNLYVWIALNYNTVSRVACLMNDSGVILGKQYARVRHVTIVFLGHQYVFSVAAVSWSNCW